MMYIVAWFGHQGYEIDQDYSRIFTNRQEAQEYADELNRRYSWFEVVEIGIGRDGQRPRFA